MCAAASLMTPSMASAMYVHVPAAWNADPIQSPWKSPGHSGTASKSRLGIMYQIWLDLMADG